MHNSSQEFRPTDEATAHEAVALVERFRHSANIERSQEAFRRALPGLLAEHERQWVAFKGSELIGIADREIELYEEAARRGLKPAQFVVRCVMAEAPEEIDPREVLDL